MLPIAILLILAPCRATPEIALRLPSALFDRCLVIGMNAALDQLAPDAAALEVVSKAAKRKRKVR